MQLNSVKSLALITFIIASITACTSRTFCPPHGTAGDQMVQIMRDSIENDKKLSKHFCHVPRAVNNALIPSYRNICNDHPLTERRFDISANKIPAKEFYMGLVEGTPYNIVVNPTVGGDITLRLKNVTIKETLQAVRDAYGYDFRRTAYGYEVYPIKLVSQVFTVNYLDVKRKGKTLTQVSSGQISDQVAGIATGGGAAAPVSGTQTTPSGSSIDTRTETNFWLDLERSLKQLVGTLPGRSVIVNRQSGVITVHALPREVRQIARFLGSIQCNMERQVILEAKILEVALNDQFQAGIDWNLFGNVFDNEGGIAQKSLDSFRNTTDISDFRSIFTLRIKGDFGLLIRLLQTQGNVQVLSSPRISTVNNQKAVIKVGQDEFFVTGVTSTTVVSGVANNAFPSENINLTPFFSGITLDVTPQISRTGDVILHIHPTVSKVRDQEKTIVLGSTGGVSSSANTFILPLAQSTIRESDNIVRAKNGQVIVIGGLLQNDMREEIAGIPIISRVPVIGPFFRRTDQIAQKVELVILLRPVFADNRHQISTMETMSDTLQNTNLGFHDGALMEVFGNEAEGSETAP